MKIRELTERLKEFNPEQEVEIVVSEPQDVWGGGSDKIIDVKEGFDFQNGIILLIPERRHTITFAEYERFMKEQDKKRKKRK